MEVILESYYILLPIVATALVGWVGVLLKEQRDREKRREEEQQKKYEEVDRIRKANAEGTKLVLRYMLNRYHTEYMMQGKITYSQYKDWIDIYKAYEALHGNSIAEDWNDDIEHLEKCNYIDSPSAFELFLQKNTHYEK